MRLLILSCWLEVAMNSSNIPNIHVHLHQRLGGGGPLQRLLLAAKLLQHDAMAAPNMILTKARDWYNVNISNSKRKCIYLSTQL